MVKLETMQQTLLWVGLLSLFAMGLEGAVRSFFLNHGYLKEIRSFSVRCVQCCIHGLVLLCMSVGVAVYAHYASLKSCGFLPTFLLLRYLLLILSLAYQNGQRVALDKMAIWLSVSVSGALMILMAQACVTDSMKLIVSIAFLGVAYGDSLLMLNRHMKAAMESPLLPRMLALYAGVSAWLWLCVFNIPSYAGVAYVTVGTLMGYFIPAIYAWRQSVCIISAIAFCVGLLLVIIAMVRSVA